MSVLSHDELVNLVKSGVLRAETGGDFDMSLINGASIDITLGGTILCENSPGLVKSGIVSLRERNPLDMYERSLGEDGYVLYPGEFILAHSAETFHLPRTIAAEYKLKSSMARIGLEHMNAGWADPGWHGSCLTLEFKNMTRYHKIRIRPGDRIGQVVFFRVAEVPSEKDYAARGRYNNDLSVSGIKA